MTEDRKQRVDRELIELLNEIRVVLPGAQVLFAFPLSLPFLARFDLLTRVDRDANYAAYFAAFLCTAVGTVLLMAPSANHRLRLRERDKERMLFWFNLWRWPGRRFSRPRSLSWRSSSRPCSSTRRGRPWWRASWRAGSSWSGTSFRSGSVWEARRSRRRRSAQPNAGRPRQSDENPTGMRTSFWRDPSSIDWL